MGVTTTGEENHDDSVISNEDDNDGESPSQDSSQDSGNEVRLGGHDIVSIIGDEDRLGGYDGGSRYIIDNR